MKAIASVIAGALCLIGCKAAALHTQTAELSNEQMQDVLRATRPKLDADGRAVLICGGSAGVGLSVDQIEDGWSTDGMKDGRIVFIDGAEPDVVFRDALQDYTSAKSDGGTVTRVSGSGSNPEGAWIISYKSTGVTETHNVTSSNGKWLDLWTSNKPPTILGASVRAFTSECRAG